MSVNEQNNRTRLPSSFFLANRKASNFHGSFVDLFQHILTEFQIEERERMSCYSSELLEKQLDEGCHMFRHLEIEMLKSRKEY